MIIMLFKVVNERIIDTQTVRNKQTSTKTVLVLFSDPKNICSYCQAFQFDMLSYSMDNNILLGTFHIFFICLRCTSHLVKHLIYYLSHLLFTTTLEDRHMLSLLQRAVCSWLWLVSGKARYESRKAVIKLNAFSNYVKLTLLQGDLGDRILHKQMFRLTSCQRSVT